MNELDSMGSGKQLFRGLFIAQLVTIVITALIALFVSGQQGMLAMAWGGAITWIASTWAGFQLWLHPKNQQPARMATAAIRAEVGRIAITLLLLWMSFRKWPEVREIELAAALLLGLFLVQVAGWIWLARATGKTSIDSSPD